MGIKCFNIEKIEEEITYWENIKQIYYRTEIFPHDDISTCTYKLYFRLGAVKAVADELIDMGFSMPGKNAPTRKLMTGDISTIIENNPIEDIELQKVVREMLKNHQKFMSKFT